MVNRIVACVVQVCKMIDYFQLQKHGFPMNNDNSTVYIAWREYGFSWVIGIIMKLSADMIC